MEANVVKLFKIILLIFILPILLGTLALWGLLTLLAIPPRFVANLIMAFFLDGRELRRPELIYLDLINALQIMAADFEEQKRVLTASQLNGQFILEAFWDSQKGLTSLAAYGYIDIKGLRMISRLNRHIDSFDFAALNTRQALESREEWRTVRKLACEILVFLEEEISPDEDYWR